MRRRWVKLLGATLALWAAVLLTEATTMALHADVWWLASLAAFASPLFLAAVAGLLWSAGRPDLGPHPSLVIAQRQTLSKADLDRRVREISRTLDSSERDDMWARLDRDLGGES